MKILFANKFFFRNGGSEVVMFDEMDVMRRAGHDVIAFSMRDARNLPSKFDHYFVSEKSYRSPSRNDKIRSALSLIHSQEAVDKISALIRNERPDILHCHNIYHQLTPSIINVASRFNIPVVLTLHDYKPICPVYTRLSGADVCTKCTDGRFEALLTQRCADGSLGKSVLLWAEARFHAAMRSYHHVDRFIAPSRFMREAMIKRFGDDKVVHIPNGIDVSGIKPEIGDDGTVLYLGRLTPEKGVQTLLQAHAADGAAWPLTIAGTGPMLDDYRVRFRAAQFVGHLTGAALETTIRKAAVVVVPSEWHENSPLSILEAMGHGKPVIASRIGGIPELVRDGVTGLLFEPKDARALSSHIRTLLGDTDLRWRLGQTARQVVEADYSLARHADALSSLYESLVTPSQSLKAVS